MRKYSKSSIDFILVCFVFVLNCLFLCLFICLFCLCHTSMHWNGCKQGLNVKQSSCFFSNIPTNYCFMIYVCNVSFSRIFISYLTNFSVSQIEYFYHQIVIISKSWTERCKTTNQFNHEKIVNLYVFVVF